VAGDLLDLVRDQVRQAAVDLELGEADREAVRGRMVEAVCVQEDRGVDLNVVVDSPGHRDRVKLRVAFQPADDRTLNVRDELGLPRGTRL
jgi:hypothetical protein